MTLAVVIVSWNVRDLLRRCLWAVERSLAGSALAYRIVVADNASADGTAAMVRAEFPQVELIETGANLGFAGGNNVALRRLLPMAAGDLLPGAELAIPDYILLLNPDTEPVGDALPRLVRYLAANPALAVVGPQLRYGDGSLQGSRRRFPTRLTFFWESTPLEQCWPQNPWVRQYRCADTPADQAQPVGWLVGAALLVRSTAISRAGLIDERFFMYSEEIEWQRRLQGEGGSGQPGALLSAIAYLPEALVIHHEGKSSEQAVLARYLNFQRSKLLLARIFFGWRFAALLRQFVRLSYCAEIAIEGAKLLVGHRPPLRRQRIGVYRDLLRVL